MEIETRLEESPQRSGERSDEQSWDVVVGTWRRMVAARGYFPTQRDWGCMQTWHAVGRRRPKTIESSVVKPLSTDVVSARMKTTERERVKASRKFSRARPTIKQPR